MQRQRLVATQSRREHRVVAVDRAAAQTTFFEGLLKSGTRGRAPAQADEVFAVAPISLTDASASGGNFTLNSTKMSPKTGAHTKGFATVDLRLRHRSEEKNRPLRGCMAVIVFGRSVGISPTALEANP